MRSAAALLPRPAPITEIPIDTRRPSAGPGSAPKRYLRKNKKKIKKILRDFRAGRKTTGKNTFENSHYDAVRRRRRNNHRARVVAREAAPRRRPERDVGFVSLSLSPSVVYLDGLGGEGFFLNFILKNIVIFYRSSITPRGRPPR